MDMSKRIQALLLAAIMVFLPCCTAFAEAMPGVATGNDLPAITEEPPTPTETATAAPTLDAATEEPAPAAEDEIIPPIEVETTEEPTVTSPAPLPAQAGDFVSVTTSTRVFLGVDDTLGALALGVFVKDAVVQVDVVEQDTVGRAWYRVRYLYGDDYANGTLKWTAEGLVYVLAEETQATDAQALTVTDYAFATRPAGASRAHRASAMDGFTLKNIHGTIGSFTVGQTGVYGSSGKDSDYKQIATLPGKGAIYATPHYLNGCPVYCLEHLYPGPGENISGGGRQPTGPYTIVDIDSYMNTPGNSKIIYHESTLHAIAWVLRHTYPFMVLDRSDASNETWSRVAGQFAIREVIKQLEGAQYVRDYWRMDEFYAAANQAPAVYLTYARWLAANGIARTSITGEITVTGQSVQQLGSQYIGKMTLTTDADLMRIRKTAGSLTGNTAGADETYYYLNSGDTVQITSNSNGFAVQIESVSSDTEEADFLIGVPDAAIQKVLIPMQGKGDVVVPSLITAGDEASATTEELWPGVYVIEEVTPPEGYLPSTKSIKIDARDAAKQSEEAVVIYEGWVLNTIKYGAQAILKTLGSGSINPDPSYVEQPEPGAEFDVYLLAAGSYESARECERDHLKTNKRGYAKTKALPYGIYVLQQTKGQPGYELKGPITFEINGEEDPVNPPQLVLSDQPIRYRLRLIKLDSETGRVITLAGTSFKLKDAQGTYVTQKVYYPTAQEIDTFTTDASGTVLLPETVTWGAYFIEEIQAPRGYLIREDDFAVFIGQDGDEPGNTYTVDIEIPDQPVKGRILLDKKGLQFVGIKPETDAWGNEVQRPIFEERYLAGAVFEVRAAEEIVGTDGTVWYQQDELVDTITTTANGADASAELPLGKYYLQEVAAPAGYVLDNQQHEVELAYADAYTAQVDVHVEVT